MTKGDKFVIGITLFVMVTIAAWQALAASKEASRNPMLPGMSSVSALPSGSKAVYLVLGEIQRTPVRWGRSFAQLKGRRGTAITYGFEESLQGNAAIDSLEAEALVQWIKEGNTVLAFGNANQAIFDLAVEENGGQTAGTGVGDFKGLKFMGCYAHFSSVESSDEKLIESGAKVVAVRRGIGKGNAYLFASEFLLSNEFLGEADNAAILTLAPRDGMVFLDDFHRGHVASGSPLELLPAPLRTAVLLSLLVGAVLVLKSSFYFGPLKDGEARVVRSGAEIAWSLSRLLRRAGASATAAHEMVRAFKTEMGVPQESTLEAAVDRISGEQVDLKSTARRIGAAVEFGQVGSKQLAELATLLSEIRRLAKDQAKGIYKQ